MAEKKKMENEPSSISGVDGENSKAESVVIDVGRQRSSCNYCRSGSPSSITHGMWAESLTVDNYQALLDKGWVRSGCYLYKPEMNRTCCLTYTIRLRATDFVPSKEQRRVSKRFQRYLDGTLDVKESDELLMDNEKHEENDEAEQFLVFLSDEIDTSIKICIENGELACGIQFPKASVKRVASTKSKSLQVQGSEEVLLFSSNTSFQIAANLKRSSNLEQHTPQIIAQLLVKHLNPKNGLSIRACNGHINFYSTTISEAKVDNIPKSGRALKASSQNDEHEKKRRSFEIRTKRSSFDPEEYKLYVKYQLKVHNGTADNLTESEYTRVLVNSPLVYVSASDNDGVPSCGFGSFHQQYLIDGKLVAVGVVDILPKFLCSKYLFWDPDLAFLSLGIFSALEEIKWITQNVSTCPTLQYYYLGYYVHSCTKLRYKVTFRPSQLLCPLRYQWISYETAKPLLDRNKYSVLSDFASSINGDSTLSHCIDDQQHDDDQEPPNNDDHQMVEDDYDDDEYDHDSDDIISMDGSLDNLLVGLKTARLRYKDLREALGSDQREYLENRMWRYMRVVGAELSEQMVYSWDDSLTT